MLELCT